MITYKHGDVLKALEDREINVMAHGCNCSGGFGSGVAGQVAKKWPHVRNAYKALHNENGTILGFFQPVAISDDQFVVNCGTQDQYLPRGIKHADYDAIDDVMESLSLYVSRKPLKVGIPKIGSALAGGDWVEIEKIVLRYFTESDITVYIYP